MSQKNNMYTLSEQAIGLVRGKRLILSVDEKAALLNLNYETLTSLHARDEACICALHFGRVRDRLLQIYPWVFARRTASISGGILPSDCLTVLCVQVNDEPVEYEQTGPYISVKKDCQISYTSQEQQVSSWSEIFCDVFVYSLAIEICPAVTGKPEYTQLLEAKVQELITKAYQIGAIQAETHVTLKEEIYNRAIALAHGQRTKNPTSSAAYEQGLDTLGDIGLRQREEIHACERASESVRDRLLQLYAWVFAKRSTKPKGTSTTAGWSNGYELPSGCLNVLTVLETGEAIDYEVSDGKVYCNGTDVTLRYVEQVTDMSSWTGAFRDAFVYALAEEICASTTGATDQITQLEQKLQVIIRDAYKTGAIQTETRIPMKNELFNRAIGLVKGIRTGSKDEKDTQYEDEVSECYRSYETLRDRLLQLYEWTFARKTETPAQLSESVPGWKYTYMLPDDCLKVLSVIAEDKSAVYGQERHCRSVSEISGNVELLDYETAGNELYANHAPVYVRYTARITDHKKWAASFKDALVILIAIEISHNVSEGYKLIQLLEQRLSGIIRDARESGVIRPETRLKLLRDSRYLGIREVPFLIIQVSLRMHVRRWIIAMGIWLTAV